MLYFERVDTVDARNQRPILGLLEVLDETIQHREARVLLCGIHCFY